MFAAALRPALRTSGQSVFRANARSAVGFTAVRFQTTSEWAVAIVAEGMDGIAQKVS